MTLVVCVVLGFVWGGVWAALLQFTDWGRFLALKRTWLTVVIGFGVDLLILLAVLPMMLWLSVCAVIGASSIAIVGRSLWNEWQEHQDVVEAVSDNADQTG